MTELRAVAQLRCIGTSGSSSIARRQPAVASPPRMAGRGNGALVAMKFGGTSVTSVDDLRRAARKIVAARESSKPVVAVLSARGATTDELLALANETCSRPEPRELDMLLSVGERISCALCAMAIQELGHRAVSLTGSQAGIITDSAHTKARILEVRADRIRDALAQGLIVLVAGFQGVSGDSRDVTTLGRGGSDLTAVALAAALGAEVCEIYSDVSGVFTADPRVVPNATLLPVVSYEEMLELSASGTKVLQLRCVEYARNHGVRIHCRSSRHGGPGTVVLPEEEMLERPFITAVAHSTDEARVSLSGLPNEPGVAARIFGALAEVNVNVDMIVQSEPVFAERGADLSFTLSRADLETALDALRALGVAERLVTDERIGKVSIVGAGMRSHPNVAAQVFRTVSDLGVNIEMISTSPIRISCVIRPNQVLEVVRALARAFGLERPATKEGKAAPAGGPPPPRA